jgi:hypothetical protein
MQITRDAIGNLLGEQVMIQLKHGWIAVRVEAGKPQPLAVPSKDGNPQMVVVPFICGRVIEPAKGVLALEYIDASSGRTVELLLDESDILSVARVAPERLITPASGL